MADDFGRHFHFPALPSLPDILLRAAEDAIRARSKRWSPDRNGDVAIHVKTVTYHIWREGGPSCEALEFVFRRLAGQGCFKEQKTDKCLLLIATPKFWEWVGAAAAGSGRTPVVFISSTSEDLRDYRSRAKDAALRAGFFPRMMEYFAASGEHPPVKACLARIAGSDGEGPADVLVVIVAHRYGWVPPDQPDSERKSITWLECQKAKHEGMEILAFLVDEKYAWADDLREEYRAAQAVKQGTASPELTAEVQDNVGRLRQFKTWLESLGIRAKFTTPDSLTTEVLDALQKWKQRYGETIRNP